MPLRVPASPRSACRPSSSKRAATTCRASVTWWWPRSARSLREPDYAGSRSLVTNATVTNATVTNATGAARLVSSPQPASGPGTGSVSVAEFGTNQWLVDELYQAYLVDKESVDRAWWDFFADYQPAD